MKATFQAFCAILLTGLIGCAKDSSALKVSHTPWPGYEIIKMATQNKYINNIEIVEFEDQADPPRAFSRGTIDIAQATGIEIANICRTTPKRCPVIILVIDQSTGGDQILSINSRSINDLKGKKIGVTTDTFGTYVLFQALKNSGITIDDVSLRPMPLEKMPNALGAGEVDAIVTYPPSSETARDFGAKTIYNSSTMPEAVLDYLIVSPEVYSSRKKDLELIVRGWLGFLKEFEANPNQHIDLVAEAEGISKEEYASLLQGIKFYSNATDQIALLSRDGLTSKNMSLVYDAGIEMGFVNPETKKPIIGDEIIRRMAGS